ncbi:MAG: signal peptidase I [Dehalococcoidia bacterium]|nr:signal peptidase I [Dehalococcoidia bacterium]
MTSHLPPMYRGAIVETMREALAQGRTATFTVRGDSMAPTLQDGDQVRIVASDPSKLQTGEVMMYVDAGNQIIIHRVVRVEGTMLITKGDNRDRDDPAVPFGRVLGKVEE